MKNKKKSLLIILVVLFVVVTSLSSVKAYSISDVEFVIPYLETDSIWNDICRSIGEFLYSCLGMFLNYAEEGFTSLMNWDIMQLPIVQQIMTRFEVVLYTLLFIAFLVVIILRIFTLQNTFKTLMNVFISMMVVTMFTIVLGLMSTAKTALITETDFIIKGTNQDTMAELLFKANTVDINNSMQKGMVVKLDSIENFNVKHYDSSLRIKRDVLNEYYSYSDTGQESIEELNDGVLGNGDERYYRYRTDYWTVNITILLSFIVYLLAIFKLGYLVYQWLSVNIFGKIGLAKGFWDMNNIGKTLKASLSVVLGMVILYFSMTMFSVLCSNIMTTDLLSNWLVKAILIFSIGMGIIVGSGFVNDFLGIDDGSNFALKSLFMAKRLKGLGEGIASGVVKTFNAPLKAMDKMNNVATKVENHFSNNENQGDFNNGNNGRNGSNGNGGNFNNVPHNDMSNRDRQNERNQRFNEFYDRNNEVNNENEKDYKRSNVDHENEGTKKGYVNQRKYRPYKENSDEEMEDIYNESRGQRNGVDT